ncbi:hypothetical protein AOQ84DRAFT_437091, partial [Glonium stellatum]
MGCCGGDREKGGPVNEEQKWDYITLSDFKSTSCIAPFSYAWLWILVITSIAVYVADAFTAINLLAFNKWSSQIKPPIPFDIAKWIFAICIILSYVLLALEWLRAIRVIRAGGVAESYLDPLAVILQSIRMGKNGQGWRRFLVFAELTTSKKGVDYIALFVYFQFKGALVIVLAEGPRVVVNALTLWTVMKASLIPEGKNAATDGHSSFQQFWINVDLLAQQNKEEVVIYFTMLFTLVIWVISALSLIVSVILYILFLWHYIPSADGRLSIYCRRKVDSRLEKIVSVKVKKALEKQDAKRRKEEQIAMKHGDRPGKAQRVPTLPVLSGGDDDEDSIYSFGKEKNGSLPPYSSQPPSRTNTMSTNGSGTSRQPTLPSFPEDVKRPLPPSRSDTQSSAFSSASYNSNAPLLSQAGSMGYGEPGRSSPVPPMPPLDRNGDYFSRPPTNRTLTGATQGPQRPYSPMSQGRSSPAPTTRPENSYGAPSRLNTTNTAFSPSGRNSPHLVSPLSATHDPRAGPSRQNTGFSNSSSRRGPGPSRLADPAAAFSPYDQRNPAHGPAYEMSPVEISPLGAPVRPYEHLQNQNQNQNQNQGQGREQSPYHSTDDYDPFRSPTPVQQYQQQGQQHQQQRGPASPPPSLVPGNPSSGANGNGNGNGYG